MEIDFQKMREKKKFPRKEGFQYFFGILESIT